MKKKFGVLCLLVLIIFIFQACEKNSNKTLISSNGQMESHNMGQNCMSCHKTGGDGEGVFQAAGTVYNSSFTSELPNVIVKLFSGPNGTGSLKQTIEVDGKGNFYSTEAMDFAAGLYPAIETSNGTVYMSTTAASGQCNSCHGVSTSKLFGQ